MKLKSLKPKQSVKKLIGKHVRHRRIKEPECKPEEDQLFKKPLRFAEDKYVLSTVPWYWPDISCQTANEIIKVCSDGTFLVRRSETAGFMFSLTYIIGGRVGNIRVHCKSGLFSLNFDDCTQPREPTLQLLVQRLMEAKSPEYTTILYRVAGDRKLAIPFKLESSLQRNISLMDHCRKVIMRTVDKPEDVWQFDIPESVKAFLLKLNNTE